MSEQITLIKPDDWHLHLRDNSIMQAVVNDSAKTFQRAMIMPNLQPPVTTVKEALCYRERILKALPPNNSFSPLMTLYLTPDTTIEEVKKAAASPHIIAMKYYPAGATTNSAYGVKNIESCFPILECMQELNFPLSIHGEVVDSNIDIFDREKVFIETILAKIIETFPALRIVLEHVSSLDGVQFIQNALDHIVTTLTPHHLTLNRNDLLVGGLKPHFYCLPIVKTEKDRQALVQAAVSGNPKFFLGTDSAPHPVTAKRSDKAAGGIYSAKYALAIYAEIFEKEGKLEALENFASVFGSRFYGLEPNSETITLSRAPYTVEESCLFDEGEISPFKSGETLAWKIQD